MSATGFKHPENNNINLISPTWNAQCDVERGGNRQLCDGAAGQVANPFLGIAALAVQAITTPAPFLDPISPVRIPSSET